MVAPVADILVVNGRLFAGGDPRHADWQPPGSAGGRALHGAADAIAVANGRIAWLGESRATAEWRGPGTEVIDARGSLVAPGFEDAHLHFRMGAESLLQVDLDAATSIDDIAATLSRWDEAHPHTEWLLGRGWHYGIFPRAMPDRALLDALVPDRPALLECFDGHTHWLNSAALARAGIARGTPDPPGGTVERDPGTAEPTGILKELGEWLHTEVQPPPAETELAAAMRSAVGMLQRAGITAVQEAWTEPDDLRHYLRLLVDGPLGIRMRVSCPADPLDWQDGLPAGRRRWVERLGAYRAELAASEPDESLGGGIVKAFADGVIESGTAWMLAPYEPDAALADATLDETLAGRPNWPPGALAAMTAMTVAAGWQVQIHAIGDGAIRAALDAHEQARAAGSSDPRGRIEHVEWPDPEDVPRFGRLGVIASMQASHARPMPLKAAVRERRIGRRTQHGWPWASILDSGGLVAFGSDWPIAPFDPLVHLRAAVARTDDDGQPEGGWLPAERLTVTQALACATWGSAFAAFADERRGTIAVGRDADLVVLDRDLLAEGPDAIPGTRVIATISAGRVVYRAG